MLTLYYTRAPVRWPCASPWKRPLPRTSWCAWTLQQASSARQSTWPSTPRARVPALATPQGTLTETPALLAYVAQAFPQAGPPCRRLRLCAHAGVSQLPRLHRARGPRPPPSRQPLGRRARGPGRHATQGAAEHDRLLSAHRNPLPQRRPVGAGRSVFGGRWLPVHRGQLAQERRVDIALFPKVHAHTHRMLQRPAVQRALAWPLRPKKPRCSAGTGAFYWAWAISSPSGSASRCGCPHGG